MEWFSYDKMWFPPEGSIYGKYPGLGGWLEETKNSSWHVLEPLLIVIGASLHVEKSKPIREGLRAAMVAMNWFINSPQL